MTFATRVSRLSLVCLAMFPAACRETHTVLRLPDAGGAPGPATVVSIANGHACAVAGGALYCWGANDEGRLGVGDTAPRLSPARIGTDADWQTVAAADRSTIALKRDGSLWAWGANDSGQLGLGSFSSRVSPARIGDRNDWSAIAARFFHACALASDGSLSCWGRNSEGQLGQLDNADIPVPTLVTSALDHIAVDAGDGHSCAIRAPGTLHCWGRNSEAELGQGSNAPLQIRQPAQVGTDTDWQAVRSGQNSTCGLRAGMLACWGSNLYGMVPGAVGIDVVGSPLGVPTPGPLDGLSFNTFGGCVLSSAGTVSCWGRNTEGQLGLGDTVDRATPTALPLDGWTSIAVGRFTFCGVRAGSVHCTGDNRSGQLGSGDLTRTNTLQAVVLP